MGSDVTIRSRPPPFRARPALSQTVIPGLDPAISCPARTHRRATFPEMPGSSPGMTNWGERVRIFRVHGVRRHDSESTPPISSPAGPVPNRHPRARPGDLAPGAHHRRATFPRDARVEPWHDELGRKGANFPGAWGPTSRFRVDPPLLNPAGPVPNRHPRARPRDLAPGAHPPPCNLPPRCPGRARA